jgi:hypothetical protein
VAQREDVTVTPPHYHKPPVIPSLVHKGRYCMVDFISRETITTQIYKGKNKESLIHIINFARVSPSPQELRDLLTHRG